MVHPILPGSDRLLSEDRLLEMLGAMPKLDRAEQLSLFPPNPTLEKQGRRWSRNWLRC